MAYDIGTAFIQIVPSFDRIDAQLKEGARQIAQGLGEATEKALPEALAKSVREAATRTEAAAREAGQATGKAIAKGMDDQLGAFRRRWQSELTRGAASLPTIKIDADTSVAEKRIEALRREMLRLAGLPVGEVGSEQSMAHLERLRGSLEKVARTSPSTQMRHNADIALQSIDKVFDATVTSIERAEQAAAEQLRKLQAAQDERERARLQRLDDQEQARQRRLADQAAAREQRLADLAAAREQRLADLEAARQKRLADQEERNRKRQEERDKADQKRKDDRAAAEAKKVAERLRREAEEAFGKTFAGRVAKQLEEAFKSLPDFKLPVDPSQGELAVKQIRDDLQRLKDLEIGVDIDAAEALRYIAQIRGALVELANSDPSLEIHVDAVAAAAELAKAERMAERLDGKSIDLKVSGQDELRGVGDAATVSLSRIEALVAGGLSLGTGLVPVALSAAAAIGFIGTAALAAGAGVGAMVLGFSGIGDAVGAMQQLEDASNQSAASFARSANQQESALESLASAERSLANTRANNADSARRAAQAVADAERAVADARREAAESTRAALERAKDEARAYAERQADAERTLARAQVDAREAREALTAAYRDAVSALADLDSAVKKNALDQRAATLEVKKAKEELDKVLLNPRATEEEREQARITYERRLLQIEDLKRQGKELADQQAEANRKGVKGSDEVVAAQERIAAADERVADAQRTLARIREDAQRSAQRNQEAIERAQLDGARRVADAERRLADSRYAQQAQARQAAFAVAQGQQAVASAARQAEMAQMQAGIAGGEAYNKVQDALDKLSPRARDFARFIFELRDELKDLRAAAADNLLPGVQTAIETALPYLPAFTEWMGSVAGAVGDLFAESARFLSTDETWRDFFGFVGDSAVPTLQQLYRIGRDVATGLAGLYLAFTPFNGDVGGGLENLARDFAQWASTLETNPSFQEFLAYVRENGPVAVDLIGELISFVARFVEAAAPIGSVVLAVFTSFIELLNGIPMPMLTALVFVLGSFAGLMLLFSSAQRLSALTQNTWNKAADRGRTVASGFRDAVAHLNDSWKSAVAEQREHIAATERNRTAMATAGTQMASYRNQLSVTADTQRSATTSQNMLTGALDRTRTAFYNAGSQVSLFRMEWQNAIQAQQSSIGMQDTARSAVDRTTTAFSALGQQLAATRTRIVESDAVTRTMTSTLAGVRAGAGLAVQGLGSLVGFLGGPWGIAITGAILAAGYFSAKAAEQKQRVDNLTQALMLLGKAYRETRDVSSQSVKDIVAQSDELEQLINRANEYGIAVEDIARAAAGEHAAQQRVIAALQAKKKALEEEALAFSKDPNERIRRLEEYDKQAKAIDGTVESLQRQFAELNAATRAQQALDEAQLRLAESTPKLTTEQFRLNEKLGANAERISYLKGLVEVFGNAESTAAQRVDALRRAIEQQTAAKIGAIEAEEAHARGVLGLTSTIEQNRSSLQSQVDANRLSAAAADKAARSLDTQSDSGLRNRDALEAAAGAVRDRYLADIEAGVPMAEATELHNKRIEALIKEADKLGYDEKKARELIDAYGDIPDEVKTVYTTKGFTDVYKELEMLQVAQYALKHGIEPSDAWAEYNRAKAAAKGDYPQGGGNAGLKPRGDGYGVSAQFFSAGGRVWGEGTSTSDSNLAWLSNREFVQPVSSVDYYGESFMEALRHRLVPKEMLPGFARGGSVTWPYSVTALSTRIPAMDEVRSVVLAQIAKGGASSGGIGSADMMRLLRVVFPGLALYSGYRQGSRTPSGNLSYHAMTAADGDKGRAVDLPPRRDVFNWIHDRYFRGTRELIWAGDPNRNIHNGRHHRYSASLLANHGVAGQPNAHIHWAYDSGGFLPPGVSTVFNGTGRPEPVFTDGQWSDISALVRNAQDNPRGGETHHWHFAKQDLDIPRLNAWANARDARGRPGRPN
ncbi:hypothetical protein [Micromonospora sp. NPDC047730]|uniref:hypothetical protein n=1 Tax=Micromonospora sp. NPDC047730 TaxID=3364253 RepID=UPI00372207E6